MCHHMNGHGSPNDAYPLQKAGTKLREFHVRIWLMFVALFRSS